MYKHSIDPTIHKFFIIYYLNSNLYFIKYARNINII